MSKILEKTAKMKENAEIWDLLQDALLRLIRLQRLFCSPWKAASDGCRRFVLLKFVLKIGENLGCILALLLDHYSFGNLGIPNVTSQFQPNPKCSNINQDE